MMGIEPKKQNPKAVYEALWGLFDSMIIRYSFGYSLT